MTSTSTSTSTSTKALVLIVELLCVGIRRNQIYLHGVPHEPKLQMLTNYLS
jgi:hypothetical protein